MAGHSVVDEVDWGLLGEDDHRRASFTKVTSYELFDATGSPVPGGVHDLRLGTTDHSRNCLVCDHGKKLCPGHRGHLELRVGVLQPAGATEARRWLRVACHRCGELLVDRERYAGLPPDRRLAEAAAAATTEGKRCPRCGAVHPRVVKDEEDHFTFWAEPPAPAEKKGARPRGAERRGLKLYPDTIRAIFDRIADEAVLALGRSLNVHPRKLVLRAINVPPNTIRPGVRSFGGAGSSYHDSTNLLQNLVKRNSSLPEQLPEAMGAAGPAGPVDGGLDRAVQNLQQIYFDLTMGSAGTSVTQGSSGRRGLVVGARPVHSFLRNIPRKEGRVRGNLLGMRVFHISRTTISGDTSLRIDQVGIPLSFARVLQVCEVVQEYNRDWLMPFFLNGRRQYPGSTLLVRPGGQVHDVAGLRDAQLAVGDLLYRDLVDGDLVFFNRQPTLERSSIGVHVAVVSRDPSTHTFRMNVNACANYGADFDGDQMNLWAARSPGCRAEARVLSAVANWYISTKSSGPVNGQVQDSVVGCYELTRAATRVDKFHAMALFSRAPEPPRFDLLPPGHLYRGREVASLLFAPSPVNFSRTPQSFNPVYSPHIPYDPEETLTVLEQGTLVRGVLDKDSVGAGKAGSIFHLVSREYGPQRALDSIFAVQQASLQFLLFRGFTVGTADLLPGAAALEQIRALVSSVVLEARVITDRLLRGEIVPPIDSTVHDFYESLLINALRIPETEVLRWVLGDLRPASNGFFTMVATGSKGSNPNLIHVAGAIGQTTINGDRIAENFSFRRTLAYFPRFSTDPAAHGFVSNSYIGGMRTSEAIFQGMNGRFDLINKALSTATTGSFMRNGIMNVQSAVVDNFRRVKKGARVVQFLYGEDGLDPRELERVSFRSVALDDAALRRAAWLDLREAGAAGSPAELAAAQAAVDLAFAAVLADRDELRRTFGRLEASSFGQAFSTDLLMPVNVRRILDGVFLAAAGAAPPPLVAAGLSARLALVAALCRRLPFSFLNEAQERRGGPPPLQFSAAAGLLCALVRAELAPPVLARLSAAQLAFVVDAVRLRYSLSLIDYGSAAGILAAQAISEPLTQYMLDSHHRSVAGGTNKSGLVRVSEIYGARAVADEKSSAMLLPLSPAWHAAAGSGAAAAAAAVAVANSIEFVTFDRFVRQYDLLLEPLSGLVFPDFLPDRAWLAEFDRAHPLVRPPADLTNWCFRFVLSKSSLVLKAVELELVVRRLRSRHPGFFVVHSSAAAPEVVVRVWLRAGQFRRGGDDEARALELLADALGSPVRGIRGIVRASVETVSRSRPDPAGGGALLREDLFAVATVGTNLYHASLHPAVDPSAAISTSVGDTFLLLGLEAARAKIISETRTFMGAGAPSHRHLSIYADEMTSSGGRVTSIARGGLASRERNNILLRMAYGDPIRAITDAAFANTRQKVYGIAARQLLGSTPQIGSLFNELVVDEDFVRKNTRSVDDVLDSLDL